MKAIFLFFCIVSSLSAHDQKGFGDRSIELWAELSQKEEAVNFYQGYCVGVNYTNLKTPVINVFYVQTKKNGDKKGAHVQPLLTLLSDKNSEEQILFDAKMKEFDNFNPLEILSEGVDEDGLRGNVRTDSNDSRHDKNRKAEPEDTIHFNILDTDLHMRMEVWRERDNGFTVSEAIFGKDDQILARKFFRLVKFQSSFHLPAIGGQPQVINFKTIDPGILRGLDLTKVQDLVSLAGHFVSGIK